MCVCINNTLYYGLVREDTVCVYFFCYSVHKALNDLVESVGLNNGGELLLFLLF